MSEDDDVPQLSAETFAALQEFYNEQVQKEIQTNKIGNSALNTHESMDENWQLSQFWYDDNTITTLKDIILKSVGINGKIALVSCPTLYTKIKENIGEQGAVTLFEFDKRFDKFGDDFIHYDYKSPLELPDNKRNYYDVVVADPPFLSEECLTKTAMTIKYLTKNKIILCTGATMSDLAHKLLNLNKSSFEPKHKNNLANEFYCFTNFGL